MIKIFIAILLSIKIIMAQDLDFANRLYHEYENYREESLTNRRFKHSDIVPLIDRLKNKNIFIVNKAGQSAEGRDIYLISIGLGEKKIFLWSQMHGDEPTATMALFDIFNFFSADDGFNEIKKKILNETTIYFMPMVNPDGAESYQRRNIFEIDVNRDAVRQQTPEGQILRTTFKDLNADFGFNLHDQSTRYSVGNSGRSAALSFLAPTIDYEKSVNKVRENSMKLIGELYALLSNFIPGHIAKYSDEFEPRAFGDNFQKWGTSTILIESGGWKDDPEKQFLRKLNFIAILSSFKSIAEESYKKQSLKTYEEIPFNDNFIRDVVLRNLKYKENGYEYLVDIAINFSEVNRDSGKSFYTKGSVDDIGDLSVYFGYEDYDFEGMEILPGKTYPEEFKSLSGIEDLDFIKLYKEGYTNIILNSDQENKYTDLPINIISSKDSKQADKDEIGLGDVPNFIITKENEIKYVVINGYLISTDGSINKIKNGLILK